MSKDMDLPFARNTSDKYEKKLLDTATKARIEDASKTAFKKVVHKTVKATEELIRNEITENILKPKPIPDVNSRNVEETVIPPEKREEIY